FRGRNDLPAGLLMLGMFIGLILATSRELVGIFRAKDIEASFVVVSLAGIVGCVLIYILPYKLDSQTTIAIYASMMVLLFMAGLFNHSFWKQRTQGAIAASSVVAFGMIYCGILPGFYL